MGKLFGTDGVRGVANKELTPMLAFRLARVCGLLLASKEKREKPYFIIGKDTRISSDMLENAIIAGLCSSGVSAVKLGVIPTPVVSFLTAKTDACGGCMISASHNPFPDNGIKFFNANGFKLEDSQEDEIEALLTEGEINISSPAGSDVGRVFDRNIINIYTDFSKKILGEGELSGIKVVIDCANGAASNIAPGVLRRTGAEVIEMNTSPDGLNINDKCGSTSPALLCERVVAEKADLGLAFDGDADRVIAVDNEGNIVDGDQMMTVIGYYLKDTGLLKNNLIVSTVMSNLGFQKAMEEKDINMVRTKVGDRYVLEEMLKSGSILGGEQSGHILLLDYNNTGDGLFTSLMLLKVILKRGKKLSDLASVVTKYPQVLKNIKVADKNSFLCDTYLDEFIKNEEKYLASRGRIVVRPSGTEPIVRVMVEAMDGDEMNKVADKIVMEIKSRIG